MDIGVLIMEKTTEKTVKKKKVLVVSLIIFVLAFSLFAFLSNKFSGSDGLPPGAQKNEKIKEAYLFAQEHPELLEKMPCHCGCMNMAHKSNKDCYFDQEGNLIEHASHCSGCTGITLDVKEMYGQGKSIAEMKTFVDEKYAPTDEE